MQWFTPLAVISALFIGYALGYKHGTLDIQANLDAQRADLIAAQRTKEAELQASMDKLREDKRRETAKLARTVAALTDSLRDRPERPAVPASASAGDAGRGCTGAELYRPDSQFLVWENSRAETIRLALITCQKAYQDAAK